ncbi:MAG: LuxR C-terminal-related transcriptional regulator [Gammaproteobacteria bacterium]
MTMKKSKMTISDDLQIIRYKGGVKIANPQNTLNPINTLSNFLEMPMSFYLLDLEGKTQKMNEEGVEVSGFDSINQSLGKSILHVGIKENAEKLIYNCQNVLENNSVKIFEEQHVRKDGSQFQFLSVKCPWYDQQDVIKGVCGFSIVLGKHSLAGSLSLISDLGILNQTQPATQTSFTMPEHITSQLTKREMECLHYTVIGYTAKRIARELNISFRTVQEYLTNIRIKFDVSSKAELIELVLGEH